MRAAIVDWPSAAPNRLSSLRSSAIRSGTIRFTYHIWELSDSMDRPALETEMLLNPRAIEAGAEELRDTMFDLADGTLTPYEVAESVYLAMARTSHVFVQGHPCSASCYGPSRPCKSLDIG